VPTLLPEPAAGLAGRLQAEVANDVAAAVAAVFEVFDEYGGWDNPYPASYTPVQLQASGSHPMKMRIPGRNLPDDHPFQLEEAEILQPEDYDKIADQGFECFYNEDFLWRVTDLRRDELPGVRHEMLVGGGLFLAECAKRGVRPFFLASCLHPFFTLCLMRGMVAFTQDLYYAPEPVERAIRRMTTDLIPQRITMAKQTGLDICLFTEERASGNLFPPRISERYWWPYTREFVEAAWSEGIVTLFHLDTCWDENIERFRELPRGSAILELDSTTDIFAAKRVLRDHLCLKGDVSAALLSVGKREQVEDYCKRLIAEVGGDGGFILGSGCSVPPTARPENFRAMIETGKCYRPW
jgi:hypothetical protein